MAAPAIMRQYFINVLGFQQDTAHELVDNQGYDDIDAFRGAKKIHIEDLCRTIRKTQAPAAAAAAVPAAGAAAAAPPPPQPAFLRLSARHTRYLYQLVHYSTYLHCTQRTHDQGFGAIANLDRITAYYDGVNGGSESDPTLSDHPAKFDNKNTVAMLEDIDNWIEDNYGRKCIPLTAYIRANDLPAQDPGFLTPTPKEELESRAPLTGDIFSHNVGLIWSMIYEVTHGTEAWSLVKSYRRNRNGRAAYNALIGHYRGHGQQNRIHTAAETLLAKSFYTGTRRFSFADYTSRLTGAFDDLESTGDTRSDLYKVNFMLQNIRNEKLRAACTHIRGDQSLRSDFTGAIDYLATEVAAIEQENAANPNQNRNISSVNTNNSNRNNQGGRGGGRGRGGRGGRGRGRGRGGRGRGNNNEGTWSENGRYFLNGGTYPNNVWWNELTANDRAEVERQRARADFRRQREVSALQQDRDTRGHGQQTSSSENTGNANRHGHQNPDNFAMTQQRNQGDRS